MKEKLILLTRLIEEARAGGIAVKLHCEGVCIMSVFTDEQAENLSLNLAPDEKPKTEN